MVRASLEKALQTSRIFLKQFQNDFKVSELDMILTCSETHRKFTNNESLPNKSFTFLHLHRFKRFVNPMITKFANKHKLFTDQVTKYLISDSRRC